MWTLASCHAPDIFRANPVTILHLEPNPDFQIFLNISKTNHQTFKIIKSLNVAIITQSVIPYVMSNDLHVCGTTVDAMLKAVSHQVINGFLHHCLIDSSRIQKHQVFIV